MLETRDLGHLKDINLRKMQNAYLLLDCACYESLFIEGHIVKSQILNVLITRLVIVMVGETKIGWRIGEYIRSVPSLCI